MSKPIKRGALLDFLESYSFKCQECSKKIKPVYACKKCSKHVHLKECNFYRVIPSTKGGTNSSSNIILVCRACSKNIDDIREKLTKEQNKKITNF